MMLDATKPDAHKAVLEAELESTGIRLNKQPADIYFRKKKTGPKHLLPTKRATDWEGSVFYLCWAILKK